MSTQAINYLEAITHIPPGATLRLPLFSWEDYERLLAELGDDYHVRVSYANECVEIMSPLPKHEAWADAVLRIVGEITRALGLKLETRGSMTMRSLWHRQGAEPDTCFYIQNATRIIGKETLDFSIDPPPDIVVEIDVTHVSTTKFSIYATLGVPEIWCYNGETMTFRVLMGTAYVIVLHSQALPLLPSTVIAQWIAVSKVEGQDAALDAVRAWVLAQSPQR